MLFSYSFSNFHSFADRVDVSLKLTERDVVHGWDRKSPSGQRVTTALAVMGANGSGKTSLVKALVFVSYFFRDSFSASPEDKILFMPHAATENFPSVFEVRAEDAEGVRWRYTLELTQKRVLREMLHRKGTSQSERERYVFDRRWLDKSQSYSVKQQGFGLLQAEAEKARPNASLISWAAQYGVETALHVTSFFLTSNLGFFGRASVEDDAVLRAARFFANNKPLQSRMRDLLVAWDLGLSDVHLKKFATRVSEDPVSGASPREFWIPYGTHRARGHSFELPFSMESSGTQSALVLLWLLLPALESGGVAVIDELENDMHPHMIEPILKLFNDQESNPNGAQLIFTTHSPEVLRMLRQCQVVFVEKNDCESTAYRGDQIAGLTSAQNLYGKYMAGALGAVPQF